MNATIDQSVSALLRSGASPATLAKLAGVNRSSAMRWTLGASPRRLAKERLRSAHALVESHPPLPGVSFGRWLAVANPLLGGLAPAAWIREGRDWTPLSDAWAADSGTPATVGPPVGVPDSLVTQLGDVQRVLGRLALAPSTMDATVSNFVKAFSIQSSMAGEFARSFQMMEVASAVSQVGRQMALVSESLRGLTAEYVRVASILPPADLIRAFGGAQVALAALTDQRPAFSYAKLITKLVEDSRPAIGSLALAMDLQLNTPVAAALAAFPALQKPFFLERLSWRRWLPQHPNSLKRSSEAETIWLLGETHNAAQASVVALGQGADGVDSDEVSAALDGVAYQFPDLMTMEVPGTGVDLGTVANRLEPRLAAALQGALDRLRTGGADSARQAAASLRAALDLLADCLTPGSKSGRIERYVAALSVDQGSPEGTLLYHQICILYFTYGRLSGAIHDRLDLAGVRVVAYGMFSAIAAVLSRWPRPDN